MTPPHPSDPPTGVTHPYRSLCLVLFLSTAMSLIWSHARLMWNDEFLSFYSDGVSTFRQVFLVQLQNPISLDPPTYHLFSHLCMNLLGRNAIALRLPALAGFLLFQLCIFFFVRRIAGDRSALIAAAVPTLTASFRYSLEGRPYGLLLGLYALSLLCWQCATQDDPVTGNAPRYRLLPLIGLTLSIALSITSHYFGVLILVPVSLGELSRILIRKRFDWGVLGALAFGLASIGLILPFQRALMVYRQHYYIKGVNIHDISQGYSDLFFRYNAPAILLAKLVEAIAIVLTLTLAYAVYQRHKRPPTSEHAYTWIAIASMALLPFFGYLFGRFVTHTMEVRYVIAALIAFAASFGIVLERKLRSNRFYYTTLALILLAAVSINCNAILQERRHSAAIMASLQLTPIAAAALHQDPHEPIFIQDLSYFYLNTYYNPDRGLRQRFSLLYSQEQEIRWLQHDTLYVTAVNLLTFTSLSGTRYADFVRLPQPLVVIRYGDWSWISKELEASHAGILPIASTNGGQLARVINAHAK